MDAKIKPGFVPANDEVTVGRARRLITAIRWREVLLLQGTPVFGALFSIGRLTQDKVAALVLLMAASFCLVAHVFVLNDWAGAGGDMRDPHRAAAVFLKRGIKPGEMVLLGTVLMALGLLLLVPLGARALAIGILILLLSGLYSAPLSHFKGVPLANSALHLAGGILLFLLAYGLFRPIDARGLALGAFFALIFTAGHLTHETRDWDGDRRNAIQTNAVWFGRDRVFCAGLALFALADGLLLVLALRNVVPRPLAIIGLVYLLQLYGSWRTLRAGLTFDNVSRLRLRYRLLYAAVGLLMVVTLLPTTLP